MSRVYWGVAVTVIIQLYLPGAISEDLSVLISVLFIKNNKMKNTSCNTLVFDKCYLSRLTV